ncbi:MAG TPA: NosD domain-containing protein, partial [Kofleriaceae bacterium]
DTIRMWEADDSVVTGNVVRGGRDVVVWYSSGNRIADNQISDARYGTHFMYSHHNQVERNRYERDVVGVFVMYSHDLVLADNVVRDAGGSAGMAIGLKDSGNIAVTGNALVHDHTALYLDQTPLDLGHTLRVTNNLFGRCDAAVVLHGAGHRTRIDGNDFIASATDVSVEGGGDTGDVAWSGNYWSEYTGYDLDGDGTGDLAYELRSFEGDLVDREPALAFFHDTAALAAADAVTRVVPIYAPRSLLVDSAPRMQPRDREHLR